MVTPPGKGKVTHKVMSQDSTKYAAGGAVAGAALAGGAVYIHNEMNSSNYVVNEESNSYDNREQNYSENNYTYDDPDQQSPSDDGNRYEEDDRYTDDASYNNQYGNDGDNDNQYQDDEYTQPPAQDYSNDSNGDANDDCDCGGCCSGCDCNCCCDDCDCDCCGCCGDDPNGGGCVVM
ncbi:hypothetical protein FGRMN_6677 [Fusarium graminum]|nr:hypothetical protein FGRMN_6677 [Fusarium graminum]